MPIPSLLHPLGGGEKEWQRGLVFLNTKRLDLFGTVAGRLALSSVGQLSSEGVSSTQRRNIMASFQDVSINEMQQVEGGINWGAFAASMAAAVSGAGGTASVLSLFW